MGSTWDELFGLTKSGGKVSQQTLQSSLKCPSCELINRIVNTLSAVSSYHAMTASYHAWDSTVGIGLLRDFPIHTIVFVMK